jgi:pilus assembly protein TadC
MRVTAIVLPLVGSFAIVWATFIILSPDAGGLAIMAGLLLGLVSAFLFRSWWAVLVIPIAFTAGTLLAFYLISLVISPNPLAMDDAPLGVFLWEVIGPITALIGALFGTFIDKKAREQRRQQ